MNRKEAVRHMLESKDKIEGGMKYMQKVFIPLIDQHLD